MFSDWLTVAQRAAERADRVIRDGFGGSFAVSHKADRSPVTEVDIAAERIIREEIRAHFPDHAIYGEELGRDEVAAGQPLWLIDPIDGTKSFVRGYPFFSTQIAVWLDGRVVVGVSNAPLLGECLWAVRDEGAFLSGTPLQVSEIEQLTDATVSTGNIGTLASTAAPWRNLGALLASCNRTRGYGDCYHYHLLARGSLEIVIESDLNILDIAALSLIVEEAGGRVTDLRGGALALDTTTLLATNGPLHESVLKSLAF